MTSSQFTLARPKRVLRVLMVAAMALVLSGCTMRAIIGIDVNEDETGTFRMSVAYDEEMRELLEQDLEEPVDWTDPASFEGDDSPAAFLDEIPEGATVEPYTEDGFEGFTVAYDFDSLAELEEFLAETETEGEEAFPFRLTSDGEGGFEFTTEGEVFEGADLSEDETGMLPPEMLADLFDIQIHLDLPGEVTSTNADETTDDGVMVWKIDPLADEPAIPAATSQVTGGGGSLLWLLLGVAAVVAVAGVLITRRRGTETALVEDETPAEETVS